MVEEGGYDGSIKHSYPLVSMSLCEERGFQIDAKRVCEQLILTEKE